MEIHLSADTQSRLEELASQSGRPVNELIEDALAGYLTELSEAALRPTS